MEPQLLALYEEELRHLRELGQEFAQEHPAIAANLGIGSLEVADPYVERLLEGFAFLTARVRLKMDAEHPRLIAQLLESLDPGFLAPVPSMLVARLGVDPSDPNLAGGHVVPRGTPLRSTLPRGQDTRCTFVTAAAVTLWPLQIVQARLFGHAGLVELGLSGVAAAATARGGLRLRLRAGPGASLARLALDELALHLAPPDDSAWRLHELIVAHAVGSVVVGTGAGGARTPHWRGPASVRPAGLARDEAMLPDDARGFSGHRLIQEIAALPQRVLFFRIDALRERLVAVGAEAGGELAEVDVAVLFDRAEPSLEALVDASSLALFCTPAVNLHAKRLDRIALSPGMAEAHAVPDRTHPMDHEVHTVVAVQGHAGGGDAAAPRTPGGDDGSAGSGAAGPIDFVPLYGARPDGAPAGFYTVRREPRRPSQRQRQHGARVPTYLGDEVFLTLLDPDHGPPRVALRQLAVQALVTNRDLPMLLPPAGDDDRWQLDSAAPVRDVSVVRGPTRPVARRPVGEIGWQLVAMLSRQHLPFGDDPRANAQALRATLALYGPPRDEAWRRQVDGVVSLSVEPVVRRLPFRGPSTFGCGSAVTLEVDEAAFAGGSALALGAAIEVWLARHAAINSFVQTTLVSAQRGVLMRWPPRLGDGAIA